MTDIQIKQKIDEFIYENISGDILAVPLNTILKDLVDFVGSTSSIQSLTWNPTSGVLGLTSSNDEVDLEAYVLSKIPDPEAQLLNLDENNGELSINDWGTPINIRDYILSILPGVTTDGVTITGDGTPGNPLSAAAASAPSAIGMGSRTFRINFDGTSGSGQVGPLILPVIPIPDGCFIAEIYVDVEDGLVANDETSKITIGIDVDDETAALDENTGLVTTLNANGVTKIITPSLSKSTASRILIADIVGSDIISGSMRVILITSDALLTTGNSILRKTVVEMQALKAAETFDAGQLYCIVDAPQCPNGLNIRAFDEANLEVMGSGIYKNQAMISSGADPVFASIWYELDNNVIHRVYEPIKNNDISIDNVAEDENAVINFDFGIHQNNFFKNVQLRDITDSVIFQSCMMLNTIIDFHGHSNINFSHYIHMGSDVDNVPGGEVDLDILGDDITVEHTELKSGAYLFLTDGTTISHCKLSAGANIVTTDTTGCTVEFSVLGAGAGLAFEADSITVNGFVLGVFSNISTSVAMHSCEIGSNKNASISVAQVGASWVGDYSTFKYILSISGLTELDITDLAYVGEFFLSTTNPTETINSIVGGNKGLNYKFTAYDAASTGVAITITGATRASADADQIVLPSSSLILTDDSSNVQGLGDWIVLKRTELNRWIQIDAQNLI